MPDVRNRGEMQFVVDEHFKAVVEFMQCKIPTEKLIGISDRLPEIARLLWGHFPQEPCTLLSLVVPKLCPSQSTATESSLEKNRECDDSVAALTAH
jgi:hypothetical protein